MNYYKNKYLKYKRKYLDEIKKLGGSSPVLQIVPEKDIYFKPISSQYKEEKSKKIYNKMNMQMNKLIDDIIKNKKKYLTEKNMAYMKKKILRQKGVTKEVMKKDLSENYKEKYEKRINYLINKAISILDTINKCNSVNDEINEDNDFFLVNDNGELKPVTINEEDRDKYYIFSCQIKDI